MFIDQPARLLPYSGSIGGTRTAGVAAASRSRAPDHPRVRFLLHVTRYGEGGP